MVSLTEEILNGKLHFLCCDVPISHPLKTTENQTFSSIFRRFKMGTLRQEMGKIFKELSHQSCSVKKAVLKKFHNVYSKTPVLESFLNKVTGLKSCNFIKKRLQQRYFIVNIAIFLRTPILKNICERLLLKKWLKPCQF